MRYEIPLLSIPEKFSIAMGGRDYVIRVHYADAIEGGWLLDISDENEIALVTGVPLLKGRDLLEPYPHLGFGVTMTLEYPGDMPAFNELGATARLTFEEP